MEASSFARFFIFPGKVTMRDFFQNKIMTKLSIIKGVSFMPLFIPNLILKDVTFIDKALLEQYHIKALVLDVDNTLTTHGSQEIKQGILDWLEKMKNENIPLMIVSNNTHDRIKPFAERLGIDFVAMGCKPMTRGFTIAQKRFGFPKHQIAVIGDQIYTDILGGNLKGCFTILVTPFELEEKLLFKIKRFLEKRHINRYHKKNQK